MRRMVRVRETRRGGIVRGCLGLVLLGFLGLCVLAVIAPTRDRPGPDSPAPVVAPAATLRVGDQAVIELPGASGVWLATTDADWNDLLDAENEGAKGGPGSGAAIYRMAKEGRARKYPVGTRVKVVKIALLSVFVEVTEGEDRGRSGWVQREFVRPER